MNHQTTTRTVISNFTLEDFAEKLETIIQETLRS